MSVVLVANTRSGRGLARRLLDRFDAALRAAGHRTTSLALSPDPEPGLDRFDPDRFRGARALLAIGGDGTVNAVADAAIRTDTPVYHVPAGNENLVARRYGMNRDPRTFLRALASHHTVRSDLGCAQGRRFLILATIGPDASVIERLHFNRTRALGHLAYLEPVLREAARPYLPSLTISVDGRSIVEGRRGWLIIANDREYASRLNFATEAGPETRSLTAVFLPATNLRDCTNWVLRAWTRRHDADPRMITAQGTTIRVQGDPLEPRLIFQLDGEHDPAIAEHLTNGDGRARPTLDITLAKETLPILVPDPARL
jgi:diacylglycerol kinase family enzyme